MTCLTQSFQDIPDSKECPGKPRRCRSSESSSSHRRDVSNSLWRRYAASLGSAARRVTCGGSAFSKKTPAVAKTLPAAAAKPHQSACPVVAAVVALRQQRSDWGAQKSQGFNQGAGPLSILDDHSRHVILLKQVGQHSVGGGKSALRETFLEAGLPEALLIDHGTLWWNGASPTGWAALTVWILQQGIRIALSGFRHPQTPASRWQSSPRCFQPDRSEWAYPANLEVVRLNSHGQLQWRRARWEISRALRHQLVGLQIIEQQALVPFCNTIVRETDPRTCKPSPLISLRVSGMS